MIQANNISNITAGKGAYGVKLNNGAGVPGVQVKDNTFTGLNGGWTHAVGLETNTSGAVVTGNTFSNLTVTSGSNNVAAWFESNPSSNTATVTSNRFNGAGYYGVAINPPDVTAGRTATAKNNWWGSACGPGTGVLVGTNVDYSPWWTDASGGGTASEGAGGSLVIPAGATTAQQQAIINCAAGKTVTYAGIPSAGGVVINTPGVTINLNGATVGPGSPAF